MMGDNIPGKIFALQPKALNDKIDLRKISRKYLKKWPFFLTSLMITMTVALVYFKFSKPLYQIKATMVIDDKKDKSAMGKTALEEVDLLGAPKVVQNEIEILKSHKLVKQVVDHLRLWVDYKGQNGPFKEDLYETRPFTLNFFKALAPDSDRVLRIQILNTTSFILIDKNNKRLKFNFDQVVNDDLGLWSLKATENLKRYIGKTVFVNISNPEGTTLAYQQALVVELINPDASVFDLSINDQKIQRGKDFINTLIFYYNQSEVNNQTNITQATLDFIDKRLDSLRGELDHAEGKVEGYQSGKGLTDISAQSKIYLEDAQANGAQLTAINIQLGVIDQLDEYVNSPGNKDSNVPATLGISDQGLISLVQKLADLQLERTKLLASLPERNPAFDPINRQIAQVKLAIKENVKNIKATLLATKQGLQSVKSNYKATIQNIPGQERQLGGLKRQQSIKENLYTYLLQQREEISLSYASTLSNSRMVDLAYALPPKIAKRLSPFAIAFIIGLIFPAGVIYGKEKFKNRITDISDIEDETSAPVIAEINYIKLPAEIIYNSPDKKSRFVLIEQFRHLRTQLNILNQSDTKSNVILITSTIAGEGKSFISNNLAVSFAKSGKKTLLLEIDVYKPKAVKLFGLAEHAGLTDYLAGNCTIEESIQSVPSHKGLDLITSGSYVDDFSELLNTEKFQTLMEVLRQNYEQILIDSPPVSIISEAYIISKLIDNTLYIVREGYTSKTYLPFIKKVFSNQQLPNMQVIFNGMGTVRSGYQDYYPSK
jgi:tyrosine-protein kinase Etk/Wzc